MGRYYADLAFILVLSASFRTSLGQTSAFQWKFNTNVRRQPASLLFLLTPCVFLIVDPSPYFDTAVFLHGINRMPELPSSRPESVGHEHERSWNAPILHDRVQAERYPDDELHRF